MINALLIDDNIHDLALFRSLIIENCQYEINIIGEAMNIEDGYKKITLLKPQLIFLDIEIGRYTSFKLLERFHEFPFKVVFVTAYDKYAIKAIQFNALDYILKPVNSFELLRCVKKIAGSLTNLYQENISSLIHCLHHPFNITNPIAIPVLEGFIMIPVGKIIYCEAKGEYTNIYLEDKRTICSSKGLGEYDELLSDYNFFRIHHSFLVNKIHIQKYSNDGELIVSN